MVRTWASLGLIAAWFSAATAVWAAQPPSWTEPIEPFQIAPRIYYVGTKGLSAYLLTSDAGAILIDGTLAENAAVVERNIESVGVPLRSVKWLVSDHAHSDHVGALARIKRDSGARFAASENDRIALERGSPRGDTTYDARDFTFPPIKVDKVVNDGDRLVVGGTVLTAHLTPGHTPGCTSWTTTIRETGRPLRVLFLCSITVAGNRLVNNRAYPTIVADYENTFAKLATMKADIVLTSHPEVANVLGRESRVRAGDYRAFIDPQALPRIVAESKQAFETELVKARSAPRP